jgi:hypothetical protein
MTCSLSLKYGIKNGEGNSVRIFQKKRQLKTSFMAYELRLKDKE